MIKLVFFSLFLFWTVQGKPAVIVSVYPLYDFVSIIAESEVSLSLLIQPNNDPHFFEPTPKDMVKISDADLFFYISEEFEPWAKKFVKRAKFAISVSNNNHENHEECDDHHDPHIWLNPEYVIEIIGIIVENLGKVIPEKLDFFDKNANKLILQINNLDSEYKIKFGNCRHKKVFFAGHNSFVEFSKRYDLEFIPLTQSFSSTAETSAKQVAFIIDEMRKSKVKFIYYDALSNISTAKTIAKETKTQILPLYSIHNASKDDFAKKVSYVEYMRRNYENLEKGLECK